MTADPATLLRLATDIETMEGPDREMDARVWCALHGGEPVPGLAGSIRRISPVGPPEDAPLVTASVDAGLALLAEKLPGYNATVVLSYSRRARVYLVEETKDVAYALSATLPLAIIAAVLRAVAGEGSDA